MQNKSIDELTIERDTLISEIEKLKGAKEDLEKGSKSSEELLTLTKENESLRKLIEQYKNDLSDATKFAQQLMLEKGSTIDNSNVENKTQDELDYEDAEKALEDYIEKKGEQNE